MYGGRQSTTTVTSKNGAVRTITSKPSGGETITSK